MSKKKRKHPSQPSASKAEVDASATPALESPVLRAPRWLPGLFVLLIAAVAFGAYSGSLDHGFTNWDDNWLITDNRHIRSLSWENIQTMFNPMAPREELGNEYLPIRDLSYAINYAFDGYNARGYHATNTLLHIFNSLLVLLLAWRLTRRRWIGCVAGLLFAVHPVHVESVAWLSSRKDLLATFFMLGSINLYLAARRARDHVMPSERFVRRVRESKRLAYSLALLFFVFALLSKMTAVVLPALLLLIELFRSPSLRSAALPRKALMLAPFWAVALLFTALASSIGTGLMREPYGDSRLESLLTAVSAIARDFQVLLMGWPLHAAVDMPVQTGFTLPVIAGGLILVALLALGVYGWRVSRKGEWGKEACMAWGAAGFGAWWFLAALSPVSNIAVQIGSVFAERYLYIPSIGICIAAATLAVMAVDRLRAKENLRPLVHFAALALLVGVSGLAAWRTYDAAKPWAGSQPLWTHALKHDPGNHVAYFNLGRALEERAMNEPDEQRREDLLTQAYAEYSRALENPARTYRNDPARVLGAMALNSVHRGEAQQALDLLDSARDHIDQPWRDAEARADITALLANPRGLALSALGRHEDALAEFESALATSDRYQGARINIASELGRKALAGSEINQAALDRAYRELNEYERRRSRDAMAIEARARLKLAEFDKRLALSGKGGEGDVPGDLKPLLEESRELYRELLAKRSNDLATPAARAAALVEAADAFARGSAGDTTAERYMREALRLKPDYTGLRTLLAHLLFERDEPAARAEANRMMREELQRSPEYKPALALKAAGLRQTAVNRISALEASWRGEYEATHGEGSPTLSGLITAFHTRENFRKQLMEGVLLLREAIDTDPDNEEGHALIEGTGTDIAVAMWVTRDAALRVLSEELLRTGFNAKPIDGRISGVLTAFYTELAEQVIARPEDGEGAAEKKRADLDALLENMLKLSERARRILSRKLWGIGRDFENNREIRMRGESGEAIDLSDIGRRMAAFEFIHAAHLLNPENIEVLDWLKKFYEEEGNLEKALEIFHQLIETIGDRPELRHGVLLSLAQLQLNLGEQRLRSFQARLRRNDEDGAKQMRDKAISAYLEAVATSREIMDNPQYAQRSGSQDEAKTLNQPITLHGSACQRLAYLVTAEAEKYYTMALEGYSRLPLDYQAELSEVRRKRSWFYRDPYKKLEELNQVLKEAPTGTDTTHILQDILNIEQRIARIEAEEALTRGDPRAALARLEQAFRAPTPEMFAVRGRVYLALAKLPGEDPEKFTADAARDLVRATSDPEALFDGAELYMENEALRFVPDATVRARMAYRTAEEVLGVSLAALPDDAPARPRYIALREKIRERVKQIDALAAQFLVASRAAQERGELSAALDWSTRAADLLGDSPLALMRRGRIQRALAEQGGDDAQKYASGARASFEAALRTSHLLTSQRLELQLELISLHLDVLGNRIEARNQLDLAERTLELADGPHADDLRALYAPKVAELKQRARD